MKPLVTGGGFIGSAVIRHIITNINDDMGSLDKLTHAKQLGKLSRGERQQSLCV